MMTSRKIPLLLPLLVLLTFSRGAVAQTFDDWVIYQITVEMFANGSAANDGEITGWKHPSYAGGDLQGVLEHVDHLQALGVNAVWLSPVFAARSSHGYDATNYYQIGGAVAVPNDPAASLELFRKLVKELHARGIKVMLDLALNHASASYDRGAGDPDKLRPRNTTARQEAEKVWDGWGGNYRYWDFDHAPTRQFLKNVALYWLTKEDVDGLRLDYVRGVPHDFWAELYADVKKAKPGAFLLGEAWIDAGSPEKNAEDIATYFAKVEGRPQLDSLFDFPMQSALLGVFAQGRPVSDLVTWLDRTEAAYGQGAHATRFFDNHDLARFLAWSPRPERLAAGVGFLASLTGPISIYYGTEAGLSQGGPKAGFTDAGRIPMPWKSLDPTFLEPVRKALQARREHSALARGDRVVLYSEKNQLVMAKVTPEETVLVGVNLADEPVEVTFDAAKGVPAGAALEPVLGASPAAFVPETGKIRWKLPPQSTVMVAVTGR